MTLCHFNDDKLAQENISIRNVVAKLDINTELDLSYLSTQLPHSSYDPEQYPSLIFRPEGYSTVLITKSGILLFTGATSAESIHEVYKQVTEEFNGFGLEHTKSSDDIEIVNIVSTFELDFELDLNFLSVKLEMENIEYEPEQFPGLVYRIEGGPVALLFSSGEIVITGAESPDEILAASDTIRELLSEGASHP
jgi:transcription initiation factor TFIID TATA-box-binding protein